MLGRDEMAPAALSRANQMEKAPIVYEDFARVDIRIGRIVAVKPFPRARNPAYKVEVDFGPLGRKWRAPRSPAIPSPN